MKFTYKEIIDLGFKETKVHRDKIYFDTYGYDWSIVEKKLTKKIYINWHKENQICEIIRMDNPKDCNILKRKYIRSKKELLLIIDFFS